MRPALTRPGGAPGAIAWSWRALLVVCAALSGCAARPQRPAAAASRASEPAKLSRPLAERGALLGEGLASYYGPGLHGRPTASGERFNQEDLTAAHRTLPFGTCVRVVNSENGRSIQLRINDRGPFVRGRVIDVSLAAARRLGMLDSGVVPVRVYRCADGSAPGTRSRRSGQG